MAEHDLATEERSLLEFCASAKSGLELSGVKESGAIWVSELCEVVDAISI